MRVITSSLAIRFYTADGWTPELLAPLSKRNFKDAFRYKDNPGSEYWIPAPFCSIDLEKLMGMEIEVVRTFNDGPKLSDFDFLKKYNW